MKCLEVRRHSTDVETSVELSAQPAMGLIVASGAPKVCADNEDGATLPDAFFVDTTIDPDKQNKQAAIRSAGHKGGACEACPLRTDMFMKSSSRLSTVPSWITETCFAFKSLVRDFTILSVSW